MTFQDWSLRLSLGAPRRDRGGPAARRMISKAARSWTWVTFFPAIKATNTSWASGSNEHQPMRGVFRVRYWTPRSSSIRLRILTFLNLFEAEVEAAEEFLAL